MIMIMIMIIIIVIIVSKLITTLIQQLILVGRAKPSLLMVRATVP